MSTYRQAGMSYDSVVYTFAKAASETTADGKLQLSMDGVHRHIASKVYSVPLHDGSPELQRAADAQLAGEVKGECLAAGGN
ncbi:hypothetical protein D3C71_1773390 [compost metagenome]